MVAISVYKGNLHKVPDVPRKWLMPARQISLHHFKSLLRRRSLALSRLFPQFPYHPNNPNNPNFNLKTDDHNNNNEIDKNGRAAQPETVIIAQLIAEAEAQAPDAKEEKREAEDAVDEEGIVVVVGDDMGSRGGDHSLGVKMDSAAEILVLSDSATAAAAAVVEEVAGHDDTAMDLEKNELNTQQHHDVTKEEDKKKEEEEENVPINPTTQTINKEDEESDKGKRKREIEEKLKILKEKKHSLVLVLKQIQYAEDELKRRSSAQGTAVRPSVPLQVDIPNDTGSMTKLNTPRLGSDGTLGSEMEGGEHDGMLNDNPDARHLLRMSTTSPSPSSDSQHKKPAYNAVQHPARTNLGVSSPSRFAPTGQGQALNLPTVSISGTNYVASSPSPAASGGTSVFRENRVPSPWN